MNTERTHKKQKEREEERERFNTKNKEQKNERDFTPNLHFALSFPTKNIEKYFEHHQILSFSRSKSDTKRVNFNQNRAQINL